MIYSHCRNWRVIDENYREKVGSYEVLVTDYFSTKNFLVQRRRFFFFWRTVANYSSMSSAVNDLNARVALEEAAALRNKWMIADIDGD